MSFWQRIRGESSEFPIPAKVQGPWRAILHMAVCFIEVALSLIGPVLSTCALLMILFVTHTFFNEVFPFVVEERGMVVGYAITMLGLYILVALVFNYLSATWVGPGHPANVDEQTRTELFEDPGRRPNAPLRYCQKCKCLKGMRTHHCSLCRKCVMKMDHHCPWINNCVGFRNHKYFLLFLFYMMTGSMFFLTCGATQAARVFRGLPTSATFMFSAVLCVAACIASMIFFVWNVILVATNQTTIEFMTNFSTKEINRFDLGYFRNLQAVFGDGPWYLWLLPSRAPPLGDGLVFPLVDPQTKEIRFFSKHANV